MRIRKKGASLIETTFLIIVAFTTTLNGQYYSEQMRQQQTLGSAVQEPLTLQEIQAEVSQPQAQLPPQSNKQASAWTYQAEPHLESLPPHLTRFLGMLFYYTNGTVFVVYTNPQALHHHKGIRSGDRILSVNGKNVKFYKDSFFSELNEVRSNRDLLVQYETGVPAHQKLLILPNITLPDRNLDKLLMAMNRDGGSLRSIQNSVLQPKNPVSHNPTTKPVRRTLFQPAQNLLTKQGRRYNHFNPFGITASEKNGRLIVEQVRPRSAAAAAQIRSGDEILTVAQKRASKLSSVEIRQTIEQEPVLIEWLPQGSNKTQRGYFNSSPM